MRINTLQLFKQAGLDWWNDNAMRLGASLAFYTALSLAPLMIIVVGVASLFFGREGAQNRVVGEVERMVGTQAADAVKQVLQNAAEPSGGSVAMTIGIVTLILGATAVFGELQTTMNLIWDVKPKPVAGLGANVLAWLKSRFLSLTMVLVIAFLLLVSLVLSAALSAAVDSLHAGGGRDGTAATIVGQAMNLLVSLPVITLLFALLFKYVPDAKIVWRDVWVGAFFSAVLFTIGKFAIGVYLGHASVGSSYGAAGSLVVLLVWVYYSSLIVFFGAEFTQTYATGRRRVQPKKHAEKGAKPMKKTESHTPRRRKPNAE